MSEKLQRFTKLLKDIFELEKSDLDFGIYRIINIRKNEIKNFIENTLAGEVNSILSKYASDNSQAKKRIEEIEKQCESVGVKVEDSKLKEEYAEYKTRLSSGTGTAELESDVYSALYNFFSRYYDEGDFISKRRYKEGVYAIPYEGEEIKLYWANHDQYYIKTSENFRNYSFKVDVQGGKFTIHFKLVDANTEQNNNKENGDKKREFILLDENFLEAEGNELTFKFEYRAPANENDDINKLRDNSKLNKSAIDKMKKAVSESSEFKRFLWAVNAPAPTEKNKSRTILEKHLETYIAKNTFDYFIHKDLIRFLNRELDFYIKSEIMHLDDLDTDNEVKVNTYLAKLKAIKKVGQAIITFLAQIEDFQKNLWLKKKFVVETNWCITLDKINESFYAEIAANDGQRQEWVELYAIDEIEGNIVDKAYSNPLTVEFLQQNKNLVLDTKHFSAEFKEWLIASIDNLDEETSGLLIHSENFQALNLLKERYREQVKCVYIDPPYNANSSEILYKNTFKHSSWLTLMENRFVASKPFLAKDFVNITAIDEVEQEVLGQLLSILFSNCEKSCISIVHNATGQQGLNFSYVHEFAYFVFPQSGKYIGLENRDENPDVRPLRNVSKGAHLRSDAANCFYPILIKDGKIIGFGDVCSDEFHPESINIQREDGIIEVYPIDPQGIERKWVFARNTVESIFDELEAKHDKKKTIWDIIRTKRKFNYKTVWIGPRYSANSYGSRVLNEILPSNPFSFPKSIFTVRDCIDAGLNNEKTGLIMDYFAGSGTTGHAVINLNREDGGNRKYILVEMGQYFNTVTKPRIKKVIYAKDWKDGKPKNRNTGVSQIFKYIRLESYEDTLNNIELNRTPEQEKQLRMGENFFNEYLVSYMLDIESRDSLLNLDRFKTPFDYKLKISENNETKETGIDLMETFNYLLGLAVTGQRATARFNAIPDEKGEYENAVKLTEDKHGQYTFKTIEGKLPNGNNTLIIWRNLTDDLAVDNAALDSFFTKYCVEAKGRDFDVIYVNGDNNLENIRRESQQWKVHLIEIEFGKRMFEEV
ncbi:MAG: DNA methyltransferase [Bacillota bacterium]|nr:DNA methyltransferase [Bacillota bacterium]